MSYCTRFVISVCTVAVYLAMCVTCSLAHGGPPLRLGVTVDPAVSAVARLVLVHLREGVGFAVDWREFPDEAALRAAFVAGRIDIAVGVTDPGSLAASVPPAGDCPGVSMAALSDDLRKRWGGEVFLLGFPGGPAACMRPALIVARAVLEDVRFGILGKEAARMAGFITRDDVTSVRAAAERGGERTATAAAREALAAKAKR